MRSLTTFLHKHQADAFSGPSRAALFSAIERHVSASPPGCEAVHLLLECALKMPEKVFAEAHKAKFLKWYERQEAVPGAGAATAPAAAEVQLQLVDIDADGTLTLMDAEGTVETAVVVQDRATVAALAKALESEATVAVFLRDGALVRFSTL